MSLFPSGRAVPAVGLASTVVEAATPISTVPLVARHLFVAQQAQVVYPAAAGPAVVAQARGAGRPPTRVEMVRLGLIALVVAEAAPRV